MEIRKRITTLLTDAFDIARATAAIFTHRKEISKAEQDGQIPPLGDRHAWQEWRLLATNVHLPRILRIPCLADRTQCPFCLALGQETAPNPNPHIKVVLYNQQRARSQSRLVALHSPLGRLIQQNQSAEAFFINLDGKIDVDYSKLNPASTLGRWLNPQRSH